MKPFSYFTILLFFLPLLSHAQDGISFQAIARDNAGIPMANQSVDVRFSIHRTTPTGPMEYQEIHTPTTDDFGLFSLRIGQGSPQSGVFANIIWGTSVSRYLKVEIDAGSGYVDLGTTEFMRVPLAYHAETAEKTTDTQLDELTDVNANAPSAGQVLKWSGTEWVAAQDDSSRWTQIGTDLSYTTGNVMIGTNVPAAKLYVKGGHILNDTKQINGRPNILAQNHNLTSGSQGYSAGTSGLAGLASSSTSEAKYGVQGKANGNAGPLFGMYAIVDGNSNAQMAAVYGQSSTSTGAGDTYGVRGIGNSSSSNQNYGGHFHATGSNASNNYGVYGSAIDGLVNYAGYFADGNVVVENRLSIGTQAALGNLHVQGASGQGNPTTYLTPANAVANDSSTLFLAEDHDATYGMGIRYDGAENELEIYGKSTSGITPPHLSIARANGEVKIESLAGTGTRNVSVQADGTLISTSPQIHKLSIPYASFIGLTSSTNVLHLSGLAFVGQGASSAFYLLAPVSLPHQAVVSKATLYYNDNATEDIGVQLSRRLLTGNTVATLASMNSAGTTGFGSDEDSTIGNATVDLDNHCYFLTLFLSSGSNWPTNLELGVRAVVIEYTLP